MRSTKTPIVAARNVKPVLLATAADVNTEQLLAFDKIIVTGNALAQLAERTRSTGMNEPYDIIQTVQLTEKASLLSEKLNKYVFRVNPRANKIQIKQAIEKLFKKKVVAREHLQLRRQEEARTPC